MLRRIILIVGALIILAMLIYPPWLYASGSGYGESHAGYHFFFSTAISQLHVNIQLLLVQIGAVGLATWFLSVALNKSNNGR
jgi:hypothetical protein